MRETLDGPADEQGPAAGEILGEDELLGLHRTPGRHIGVGGRVVGQDRDDRAQRNVPDLLGEHDDGDRALAAERVDGQRGSQAGGWRHGPFGLRKSGTAGALRAIRAAGRGNTPEQAQSASGHKHTLTVPSCPPLPAVRAWSRKDSREDSGEETGEETGEESREDDRNEDDRNMWGSPKAGGHRAILFARHAVAEPRKALALTTDHAGPGSP